MEEFSQTAFWLALGFTAAAVLFYWGYSFGVRVVMRRLATNGDGGVTVPTFERLPESFGWLGSLAAWAATAFLALSLIAACGLLGYGVWDSIASRQQTAKPAQEHS